MNTAEDYYIEAMALDIGKEKARLLEKAAELADQEGLEEKAFEYRFEIISALFDCHEDIQTFTAFSWVLNRYDKNPEQYESWTDSILWRYKWIVDAAADIHSIPMEKVKLLLDDYIRRVRKRGFSDYSPHMYSMLHYTFNGEFDKAEKEYQATLKSKHDHHSDCVACVPLKFNVYLFEVGRYAEAWELFEPILSGRETCAHVPSLAWPEIALTGLMAGRNDHRIYYQKAWAQSLLNRDSLNYRSYMLEYITRENLIGDFRKFMLLEFNNTAHTSSEMIRLGFLIRVEAALCKFKNIWDKIDFCEGLFFNEKAISSWQELYTSVGAEVKRLSVLFDKRTTIPLQKLRREKLISELLADDKPYVFDLTKEALGEVPKKAVPVETKKVETFSEYCERYYQEIEFEDNWKRSKKSIAGKSAEELFRVIKDNGIYEKVSYAALDKLHTDFADSDFYPIAIWEFLYGEEWTTFGARICKHFSDKPKVLKMLLPDLVRWPNVISEFAVKNFLNSCSKKDQSYGYLQQALIRDKRGKNEDHIESDLAKVKLADLKSENDLFEYASLVKRRISPEASLKIWKKISERVEGEWKASAYIQWGYTLSQLQMWEETEKTLLKYLELASEPTPYAYLELSWALRHMEKFDEALPHGLKAAEELPYELDAQMEAGLSCYALGEYADAAKHLGAAHEIDRDNSYVSERYGLALRLNGDFKEAIKIFKRCLKTMKEDENDDTSGVTFSLAVCRLALGNSPAAIKSLVELIKKDDGFAKIAMNEIKDNFLGNNQVRKWDNLIKKLWETDKSNSAVIHSYARYLAATGEMKEAVKLAKSVAKEDEEYLSSYIFILYRNRDYKKVCNELKNYEGFDPGIISLHWDALMEIEDYKQCRKVTDRMKQYWPGNLWILNRDCELLIKENKSEEALAQLNKLLKEEEQPELLLTKIKALKDLKKDRQLKTAMKALQKFENEELTQIAENIINVKPSQ